MTLAKHLTPSPLPSPIATATPHLHTPVLHTPPPFAGVEPGGSVEQLMLALAIIGAVAGVLQGSIAARRWWELWRDRRRRT